MRLLAPAISAHLRSLRIWWCTGSTCTQAAGWSGTCKQHRESIATRPTYGPSFKAPASGYVYTLPCCSVTLQHSGAQMLTLGLPRSSGVMHTITQDSIISMQSAISSATSAGGHLPDARLVVIQPAETPHMGGGLVRRRKPADKVLAVLWWWSIPAPRLSSLE